MQKLVDRRKVLLAAGTLAAAAVAGTSSVQSSAESADIRGTVTFEGGTEIPKGELRIYIDDPAIQGAAKDPGATTRVASDGGSKRVDFALSSSESSATAAGVQVVALLERADGWLLARGSATSEKDAIVRIVLYKAMY